MVRYILSGILGVLFCFSTVNAAQEYPYRRVHNKNGQKKTRHVHSSGAVPRLNSQDFDTVFNALCENVKSSTELSSGNKKIILTCLEELSKTRTGRYIFRNVPDSIVVRMLPGERSELGLYSRGKLSLSPGLFRKISDSSSQVARQRAMLTLTSVIAHELIHATQDHLRLCTMRNTSYENYAVLRKFREMHAALEQHYVTKELLDAPFFILVKNERRRRGELDTFLNRAETVQMVNGFSPERARRFSRTEFVRSYWSNTPDTPVAAGGEILFTSFTGPALPVSQNWNLTYNRNAFEHVRSFGKNYWKKTGGMDIHNELQRALNIIGLDLTPEFIMTAKSFKFRQERLIAYVNGGRQAEIIPLGSKGYFSKVFDKERIVSFSYKVNMADGDYKDLFPDSEKIRAEYQVTDGRLSGIFREYDRQGRVVVEIPFHQGKADGRGSMRTRGKIVPLEFRNGKYFENGKKYHWHFHSSKCWQQKYIQENRR